MGSFYMEATQINYRRDETLKTVDQKLQELSEESAVDTDIAPVFSKTATYNPGDLVYYKNKLYVCNTQHSGAWAAGDFTATTVSGRITATDEAKADNIDLAPAFNSESSYAAGDLVTYNGTVYRCTNDHTGAWDANDFSATTISAELGSLKSGLTNYEAQNNLNLEVANRKNILPLTIAEIKTSSTAGTWSGNNYTVNGVTFAVITDENGAVTSINATGTASADAVLIISRDIKLDSGNYIMNGCPNGGSSSTYEQYITTPYTEDVGDGVNFTITTQKPTYAVKIVNGYATPIGGLTFYPMIRPATITDPTFAPYIPSVESRIESVESDSVKLFENICSGVKIKHGYKGYDADVITFDSGYYIFIAVKTLYGNSAIYAIDGSSTPQSLGGKDLGITQTVNNSRISLSFVGNYMQFMLVRLNTKADFTDEIHLTVASQ